MATDQVQYGMVRFEQASGQGLDFTWTLRQSAKLSLTLVSPLRSRQTRPACFTFLARHQNA